METCVYSECGYDKGGKGDGGRQPQRHFILDKRKNVSTIFHQQPNRTGIGIEVELRLLSTHMLGKQNWKVRKVKEAHLLFSYQANSITDKEIPSHHKKHMGK